MTAWRFRVMMRAPSSGCLSCARTAGHDPDALWCRVSTSRSQCPCGQTFSIPMDAGPHIWSCYACGRKLSLTSDGRVLELSLPKTKPDERVFAGAHAVVPDRVKEIAQDGSAEKPALACSTCGISLHATCGWCGQAHCWLHTPADHPGQTSPYAPSDLKALAEVDSRLVWLFYLAPLFVYVAWILVRLWMGN
jgi:hypothetical protein